MMFMEDREADPTIQLRQNPIGQTVTSIIYIFVAIGGSIALFSTRSIIAAPGDAIFGEVLGSGLKVIGTPVFSMLPKR